MAWDQIGFTENLVREDTQGIQTQQVDPLQFEQNTPEFSGSKLTGLLQSRDGRVQVNLDENYIIISDGIQERVRLGKQSDGAYGLLVKDENGNQLMNITGATNLLQSADKSLEINFNETQIVVRNAGGTPVVLMGKQIGGF